MLRFSLLSVCICQFAREMGYITAFLPGFSEVGPD
jgi:hypothetical protein